MAEENNNNEENITVPNVDLTGPEGYKGIFDIDKTLGLGAAAIQARSVDNTAIEEYIGAIEAPASGSALDKVAALYRAQGEGAVLRMQRNVRNLIGPTVNLIKEREAAFQARFAVLQETLPDISNSTIFGDDDGTPIPITDDIVSRANQVREDMRLLAALNPADERYAGLQKKIEKNQDVVVNFDVVNKQLLEIRNGEQLNREDWSDEMTDGEKAMWTDIYNEKGENIKVDEEGKLIWQDPNNPDAPPVYLDKLTKSPKVKSAAAQEIDTIVRGEAINFRNELESNTPGSAANSIGSPAYNQKMLPLYSKMRNLNSDQMNSLIWNGLGGDPLYDGIPSDSFITSLIANQIAYNTEFNQKYGGEDGVIDTANLSTDEMLAIIDDMKRDGPIKQYYDAEGNLVSMKTQFLQWYKNSVDGIITNAAYTPQTASGVATPPVDNTGGGGGGGSGAVVVLAEEGRGVYNIPGSMVTPPSDDTNRDMLALNTFGQGDPIITSVLKDQGIDVNLYDVQGNFKGAPTDDPNLTASVSKIASMSKDGFDFGFGLFNNYIDTGKELQFSEFSDVSGDYKLPLSRNTMAAVIGRESANKYIGKDGNLFNAPKIDFAFSTMDGKIYETKDGKNWKLSAINKDDLAYNNTLKHLSDTGALQDAAGNDIKPIYRVTVNDPSDLSNSVNRSQLNNETYVPNKTVKEYDENSLYVQDYNDKSNKNSLLLLPGSTANDIELSITKGGFINTDNVPKIAASAGNVFPEMTDVDTRGKQGLLDYNNAQIEFVGGIMVVKFDPNDRTTHEVYQSETQMKEVLTKMYNPILDQKIDDARNRGASESQQLKILKTHKDAIVDFINTTQKKSKVIFDHYFAQRQDQYLNDATIGKNSAFDKSLNKITQTGKRTFGGKTIEGIFTDYGDDDFIVNRLNAEFGKYGFEFTYSGESLDLVAMDVDAVRVTHPNIPGGIDGIDIMFDQGEYYDPWKTNDKEQANALKMLLRAAHTGNIALIENIVKSRHEERRINTATSGIFNIFVGKNQGGTDRMWAPINTSFKNHNQNTKQIKSNQKALIKQLRLNNPNYKGTDKELLQYYLYSPEALKTLNF